ncbi:MAG: hypothetical protein CL927_12095 [Deltaproteobacteria bacterium]|nr:hypothetical protein [Deltaproteobacteria bacterium]HCH61173.1 hypothetical protein [Deltaproteobacteria bacterium]
MRGQIFRTLGLPNMLGIALLMCACSSKGETGSEADAEVMPFITGTVSVDGQASAEVAFYKAFAYNQGGTLLAYLSSSPSATCTNVADYLQLDQPPYDPVEMFEPSTCNLMLKIEDEYLGGFTHNQTADADQPNFATLGSALNCAMGEGSFEYVALSESDDPDYNWSGRWWEGGPFVYNYNLSGGDGEPYTFDIEMSAYDGSFVHESLNDNPANGAVSGTISAEWCERMGSTGLF